MKTFNLFFSIIALITSGFVSAQTKMASFESEDEIWYITEQGYSSSFTVEASQEELDVIKERFDNLGSSISYSVNTVEGDNHQIIMNFDAQISKVYLYKMLLYIGCSEVSIGEKKMDLNEFLQLISL
jgi:hypothetical protein